ncbi:hypothetical protein, partial [Microcoleus sp.]|uniref:hypothetical protein n=1 Tax=Microcoleus sp. TaxID=44472 RepID=UPI0035268E4C
GGRGTKDRTLIPPFLRGARGDLDLIVKQQSVATFDLKLTPMPPTLPIHDFVGVSEIGATTGGLPLQRMKQPWEEGKF